MAPVAKKGFVRVVMVRKKKDSNENDFYDSAVLTYAQCLKILEEYRNQKNLDQIFDLELTSGAHIFLDAVEIQEAWFIPESFLNNED